MQAIPTTASRHHNRTSTYRANCDSYSFFNLLTSEALLDRIAGMLPTGRRERLYPPTATLALFLAQATSS